MAQEFFINSQTLQDKISKLLPSQGGAGAGFDLSASSQIIPIIDLTEAAEGSDVRPDLQSAFSFDNTTFQLFTTATITLANTPGYWRVFGSYTSTGVADLIFELTDGASPQRVAQYRGFNPNTESYDFIVYLKAGISLTAQSTASTMPVFVATRQIADINGELISP